MMTKIKISTLVLLAFAAGIVVSFFTLPLWVAFAVNFSKEGSRTDWLGFVGSIVGAFMTVGAAAWAWFSVQQQIAKQEEIAEGQMSMQRALFIRDGIALIEKEIFDLLDIGVQARVLRDMPETHLRDYDRSAENFARLQKRLQTQSVALNEAAREYAKATSTRWAIRIAVDSRMNFILAVHTLNRQCAEAQMQIISAAQGRPTTEIIAAPAALDFRVQGDRVSETLKKYNGELHAELRRLAKDIKTNFKAAKI